MKQLTIDNWNEIDPIIASGVFVRVSLADGSVETVTSRHWVERSLRPQLSPEVPEAVVDLFDIARGAILYGVCFYPLFTLGLEQILRVQEAAARARAVLLGVSRRQTSLREDPRRTASTWAPFSRRSRSVDHPPQAAESDHSR